MIQVHICAFILALACTLSDLGLSTQQEDDIRLQSTGPTEKPLTELKHQLPELSAAVAENPDDPIARAKYAQALFLVDNFPAAWEQIMVAYKLKPSHSGIADGIYEMWRNCLERGILNVGVSATTVQAAFGEPSQRLPTTRGERLIYAFIAVELENDRVFETMDMRNITEAAFKPSEVVRCALDGRSWTPGLRVKTADIDYAGYFLPGESISNCSEWVSVERILDGSWKESSKEFAKAVATQLAGEHPNSKQMIIEVDENSVIIALENVGLVNDKIGHQLIRFFRGSTDLHCLTYTIKSDDPPSMETQMKWLKIFQSGFLKSIN